MIKSWKKCLAWGAALGVFGGAAFMVGDASALTDTSPALELPVERSADVAERALSGGVSNEMLAQVSAAMADPVFQARAAEVLARAEADSESVHGWTRSGSTVWLTKWDVAWMAGLSTAGVIALLIMFFPISVATAWQMVGVVIGVFWAAALSGRCAWITRRPFSAGTYAC